MRIAQRFVPLGLLLLAPCLAGWSSCGSSLNEDPSFDLWCGDHLCAWEQEAGSVRRVPTWHEQDAGVELVGDPSAISQHMDLSSVSVDCLRFEMLTEIEDGTMVTLELDFLDDGAAEVSYPVPATRWAAVEYRVVVPTWFEGLRLRLKKTGPGRAVLAHVRLTSATDCSGEPLSLIGRPLGATCAQDAECDSGRCTPGPFPYAVPDGGPAKTCGLCADTLECPAGQVCGVEPSEAGLYLACGPADRHVLGERCRVDDECGTGVCCQQMCSTCCEGSAACPAGQTCERAPYTAPLPAFTWIGLPFQCDPGQGQAATGDACLVDADCASGDCLGQGALMGCLLDNHPCSTDADCPLGGASEEGPACRELGVRAGECG